MWVVCVQLLQFVVWWLDLRYTCGVSQPAHIQVLVKHTHKNHAPCVPHPTHAHITTTSPLSFLPSQGADRAFAFSSGMAAIAAVCRLVKTGEHIVAGDDLYGGTSRLLSRVVPNAGVQVSNVDTTDVEYVCVGVCVLMHVLLYVWMLMFCTIIIFYISTSSPTLHTKQRYDHPVQGGEGSHSTRQDQICVSRVTNQPTHASVRPSCYLHDCT